MPSATISATPYNGPLSATGLLTGTPTLLLPVFGPSANGTLFDTDNSLGNGDDGVTTFNGSPVIYIGSGTATPGIQLLPGVIIATGTPRGRSSSRSPVRSTSTPPTARPVRPANSR